MADLYLTEAGDLAISTSGDIAVTDTFWRDDAQQAYIRAMTDPGDFLLYDALGAGLSRLYGMPQTPETGRLGVTLIESALDREGRFRGKAYRAVAVPISEQSIRFDIYITSGFRQELKLSVAQSLTSEPASLSFYANQSLSQMDTKSLYSLETT